MDPKPATCTKDHCTAVDPSWCHTCVHNRRPAPDTTGRGPTFPECEGCRWSLDYHDPASPTERHLRCVNCCDGSEYDNGSNPDALDTDLTDDLADDLRALRAGLRARRAHYVKLNKVADEASRADGPPDLNALADVRATAAAYGVLSDVLAALQIVIDSAEAHS